VAGRVRIPASDLTTSRRNLNSEQGHRRTSPSHDASFQADRSVLTRVFGPLAYGAAFFWRDSGATVY
jgi:hypothetical protein